MAARTLARFITHYPRAMIPAPWGRLPAMDLNTVDLPPAIYASAVCLAAANVHQRRLTCRRLFTPAPFDINAHFPHRNRQK